MFLNKTISTRIGLVVILTIAVLAGYIMINEYKQLMEERFQYLDMEIYNKDKGSCGSCSE